MGFYKRRLRDVDGVLGQSGAVSVAQRVSSDLRLNPHLHTIVLDGVFVADNGSPVFHPLTHLDDSDLANLLQVIRVRLVNFLLRRGVRRTSKRRCCGASSPKSAFPCRTRQNHPPLSRYGCVSS